MTISRMSITTQGLLVSRRIPDVHRAVNDTLLYVNEVAVSTNDDTLAYNSSAFLPYHRYLLHIYENELKLSCNYHGNLP